MHYSVKTIKPPEFVNLQFNDINPFITSCDIKVLYVGENRNRTSISKAVATEMSKTLRGSMIVGYYREEKQDFADHGQVITIDDEGMHFNVKTTPYGFVSPDAPVWFQTFNEYTEDNEPIEREYLMTKGYLWTKAFPETEAIFNEGRPQSMELDNESVQGTWVKSLNNNYEILIINDAIFSKLCILGEDVEPCFEGASITKSQMSANFTLDTDFKNSVYTMMNELKEVLQGGIRMDKELTPVVAPEAQSETVATEYVAKDDEKKENKKEDSDTTAKEENATSKEPEAKDEKKDDEDKNKKYSLDSEKYISIDKYNELKNKYSTLENTVVELQKFKAGVEKEQKQKLVSEFTMLTDEDKADIINNIDKYTLDEIESKLSVICFRKKVNFVSEAPEKTEIVQNNPIVTYTALEETNESSVPNWVKAIENNLQSI